MTTRRCAAACLGYPGAAWAAVRLHHPSLTVGGGCYVAVVSGMTQWEDVAVADVVLREIEDGDLDGLFEQMRDAESVRMAAFVSRDPNDREAFDAHMARVRSAPGTRNRAITRDGHLVGSIASFVIEGDTEITYWIDRSVWGQGLASTALTLFLQEQQIRPLHARAASDNAASIRVLQKAGFRITGTEISYANARGAEIEETILRLD